MSYLTYLLFSLVVGTQTYPYLLAWNGQNNATEHLQVSDDTNSGAGRFYARATTGLNWGAAMAAHVDGDAQGVGLFAYGENAGTGITWGANLIGASYSGFAAVGVEVNGVNRSGQSANVHGAYIANGGNAPTLAGLTIETSLSEPLGKPRYAIFLAGPNDQNPQAPASEAGIHIDPIDSGVAMQIAQGDKILLSHDGTAYLYYDGVRIRFVRNGSIRGSW